MACMQTLPLLVWVLVLTVSTGIGIFKLCVLYCVITEAGLQNILSTRQLNVQFFYFLPVESL